MKKTLLLIFLLSISNAFACICTETNITLSKKVEKAFSESDLIISGKVIDLIIVNTAKHRSSNDPIIYKFEITKVIKGELKKELIEIVSKASESRCGYEFKLGKSYLVYARKSTRFSSKTNNEFDFVTGLCDRNQNLKYVLKKEFRKLEKLNDKD